MFKKIYLLLPLVALLIFSEGFAQPEPVPGKVIPEFGLTYKIENPDFHTSITEKFEVLFDIAHAPEDPSELNRQIESVARFLNMHSEAGKPFVTMVMAMVIHGQAAHGLLKNEFYKKIYKVDNPNIVLFEAIQKRGVQIILCDQNAMHRNITEEKKIPQAGLALSAMTALVQLHNSGYRLISF